MKKHPSKTTEKPYKNPKKPRKNPIKTVFFKGIFKGFFVENVDYSVCCAYFYL